MSNSPKTIYLKDYQAYPFQVEKIYLHVDLFDDYALVKSILHCERKSGVDSTTPLYLNGEHLSLKKVVLNGKLLTEQDYQVDSQALTIHNLPDAFTVETVVEIKPQENESLMGLYRSRENFCTQCEAQGFRRITYFPDRPDVMTRFTTTITAEKDKYPILLSNGNLLEEKTLSDNRHWVSWEDPSLKSCHLFALVAGDFDLLEDNYKTLSGRLVKLRLYVEKGFLDQSDHAMASLKKAMQWDEQRYGREYDLAIYMIVAVSDFNMGAMENKGLNIFNTRYVLAKAQTATDQDFVAVEGVIGHEYFHNWTGNRVTCRDWFQLTLKEGLTVFRDQTFTEDMTSAGVARISSVNVVREAQFLEDAGPMAHPIRPDSYMEINNFYTLTVYRKGAEVIRMVRTLIGAASFHRAMDLYFERYDGQAVTTEDFIAVMEEASGRDLTQFRRWYTQAGTPELKVTSDYCAQEQRYTLVVAQSCRDTPETASKKPFYFPLAIGLLSSACVDMPTQLVGQKKSQLGTRVLEVSESQQQFTFTNVTEKPVLSLLRGFSAPVKVSYDYSDEELLWLFLCDSDYVSRYDAGQHYMKRLILKYIAGDDEAIDLFVSAYSCITEQVHEDKQYLALLLQLPSFSYLIQDDSKPDIAELDRSVRIIRQALGNQLRSLWLDYYQQQTGSYQFTMSDVGKRALRNLALSYLCATEDAEYYDLAYHQLVDSDNMTDQMGALMALNHHDCEQRERALSQFYQQWQSQPLVVNKWLALQSGAFLPKTLNVVKEKMQHAAFDMKNPNNVYALVGGFVSNLPCFHHIDGSGYQFLSDVVIKIDRFNPQVAARMLQPLTQWQQWDKKRQALMRNSLRRIAAIDNLSSDVYEIVTKSLQ